MADNTTLNPGTAGDIVRDIQRGGTGGPKTQVIILDIGGEAGPESLVTPENPLPFTAAVLPLPNNAAEETGGNLAIIAAAQGSGGTGITPPTGGSGILGWASGIYQKLSGSIAVTGTFWQATQPVSAVSLPLPTGASTAANQTTEIAALDAIITALGEPLQAGGNIGTVGAVTAITGALPG